MRGFPNSAKEESLAAIGEAMAANGRVIVTGCMGVEEGRIRAAHPGVLAVTGPQQYEQVVAAVHEAVPPLHDPFVDLVPPEGIHLTPRHYAYLKISEGCNNRCTFCIIPSLRGDLASRPAASAWRRPSAWSSAVSRSCSSSARTPAPTASTCATRRAVEGAAARRALPRPRSGTRRTRRRVRLHYVYLYPHVDDVIPLMAEGRILFPTSTSRSSTPRRAC